MHLACQPRPQGAFPWTRLVTPGLVEEKFESRFRHPCSNQLNITISATDNQSIVTENRIYEIMEFSLKDKKPGKKSTVKVQLAQSQICMRYVLFHW